MNAIILRPEVQIVSVAGLLLKDTEGIIYKREFILG